MVYITIDKREVGSKVWLPNGKLYIVNSIEGSVATLRAIDHNIPEEEPIKYLRGRPIKVNMEES